MGALILIVRSYENGQPKASGINGNTAYAIPHERLKNILAQYNRLE